MMPVTVRAKKDTSRPEIAAVLFTAAQIAARVRALAKTIQAEGKGQDFVLVGVLKGSFVFIADLLRALNLPVELDFLSLSSYAGDRSSEIVRLNFDIRANVRGKKVLLVDDIVDTGFSLAFARKHLLAKGASDVEVCVLLDKPARRKVFVPVRYIGFSVPDAFVVGYGLDYNERYRELPYIGVLKSEKVEP